ncbi:MAG: hypothetical protein PHE24_02695 [Patescibacteria group bacterium]|nr:hypothetical protein [Patescibacteria group bacterium]
MDNKIERQQKFISWTGNKKIFYPVLGVIIALLILLGFWLFFWQPQMAAKRTAELQQQKAAQVLLDKRKNATYSRQSFFLSAPAGAKGALNVPSFLEGFWRMSDTNNVNRKTTILYVKNPNYAAPLMYIRYDDKASFKLAAGETELKTNSTKYSYVYYFYPVDSYPGADQADFSSMQKDFQDALKTFGIF